MTIALITGIGGQDGSYLAELLLSKGYAVHGVSKSTQPETLWRIKDILPKVKVHTTDLTDQAAITQLLKDVAPDEVYNLASSSFVPNSWLDPKMTSDLSGFGVLKLLEGIRTVDPKIRFFQAGSAEMFGQPGESPQNESTPLRPTNPYGVAKTFAHSTVAGYRQNHGIYAVSGIMFNHESPRRDLLFVFRKITNAVAKIKTGKLDKLKLGNLEAKRDWGSAQDYVEAMWLSLQQSQAQDYVIATGKLHSVQELVDKAFGEVGLDPQKYVSTDPALFRPMETVPLLGNPARAEKMLGWKPRTSFEQLIKSMVAADLKLESGVLYEHNPRN